MASAMGATYTWLLTNGAAAWLAVDPTVVVFDGPVLPYEPPPPIPMVFVGATDPNNSASGDGTNQYHEVGRARLNEEFWVPCYIDCAVGGTDQSTARNAALALYDAIVHAVANDLTLGGALLDGRVAEISDRQITQTHADEESEDGRRCVITFRVHCDNHYTP